MIGNAKKITITKSSSSNRRRNPENPSERKKLFIAIPIPKENPTSPFLYSFFSG
jgi:hypothetical protein